MSNPRRRRQARIKAREAAAPPVVLVEKEVAVVEKFLPSKVEDEIIVPKVEKPELPVEQEKPEAKRESVQTKRRFKKIEN